jgi:hypothetical protein
VEADNEMKTLAVILGLAVFYLLLIGTCRAMLRMHRRSQKVNQNEKA